MTCRDECPVDFLPFGSLEGEQAVAEEEGIVRRSTGRSTSSERLQLLSFFSASLDTSKELIFDRGRLLVRSDATRVDEFILLILDMSYLPWSMVRMQNEQRCPSYRIGYRQRTAVQESR